MAQSSTSPLSNSVVDWVTKFIAAGALIIAIVRLYFQIAKNKREKEKHKLEIGSLNAEIEVVRKKGQIEFDKDLAKIRELLGEKKNLISFNSSTNINNVEEENLKAANELIEKNIILFPDNEVLLHHKGILLTLKGDYQNAIKFFEKALEIKSDYSDAYRGKGIVLMQLTLKLWSKNK